MVWRRRRNTLWGDRDDMFRDLAELEDRFDRIWDELQNYPNSSWYYGLQISSGPDGKPVVKEFGNIRPGVGKPQLGVREPLSEVSVDEKERKVKVFVEMPGAEKESINVNATEDSVSITADSGGKPYKSDISFPVKIEPDSADASYTNGILEISFKMKGSTAQKGVNVKVK
jgi:HSP20 family protein